MFMLRGNAYIHIYRHACVRASVRMYVHTYVRMYVHTYVRTYLHMWEHPHIITSLSVSHHIYLSI